MTTEQKAAANEKRTKTYQRKREFAAKRKAEREAQIKALREIRDNPDLPLREKIEKIITITTPYEIQLDVARIPELKEAEPEVFAEIDAAFHVQWESVRDVLEEAISKGVVRTNCTPNFIITVLYASMTDFLREPFLRSESLSYTEAVHRLADLVLNGIFAQGN